MGLHVPSMNKLVASLYLPHWSPMAALRLVYRGSRSMRGMVLGAFGLSELELQRPHWSC